MNKKITKIEIPDKVPIIERMSLNMSQYLPQTSDAILS
jgi:hypothetical protein